MDILKKLTNEIYKLLPNREENIDFAFPSRSVYIESDNTKIEN